MKKINLLLFIAVLFCNSAMAQREKNKKRGDSYQFHLCHV